VKNTNKKQDLDYSTIDRLREALIKLVETRSHELPEEALQVKREIRNYFIYGECHK
jgi:hypothetical protein